MAMCRTIKRSELTRTPHSSTFLYACCFTTMHCRKVPRRHSSSLKQEQKQQAFDIGKKKQVVVTHVENCWSFWAQVRSIYLHV